MDLSFSNHCHGCGAKYVEDQLLFVDGEYWCRSCLWDRFYTKIGGLFYCAYNWEQFMNQYPDGMDQLRQIFRKEPLTGANRLEEYVSENLEDYCDYILDFGDNERLIKATFDEIRRLSDEQIN